MTSGKQIKIDFDRATQLRMLDRALLPKVSGVSGATLKGVLRALDSFCRGSWGYPSEPTLAVAAGLGSRRSVVRAIQALESIGIVICERRRPPGATGRKTSNHYLIVWSEVAVLCPKVSADQCDFSADQCDFSADQCDFSADQCDLGVTLLSNRLKRIEPPPPAPSKFSDTSQAGSGQEWAAAECALKRAGVEFVTSTTRLAQQREMTAAEVLHVVETYEAQPGLFSSPGAIRIRIREGAWPATGVQDPRVIREARAAQDAARRQREAEAVSKSAEAQADRAEAAALEVAYGAELDALDSGQLQELARATFRSEFEFARFRRDPRNVRYELLVAIHANRAGQQDATKRPVRVGKAVVREGRLLLIETEG